MDIPEEFKAFASLFDLQLHDQTPNEHELIAFAIKHTPSERKHVVKTYLGELLSRNPSGNELQEIWLNAGASLLIRDQDELRYFLALIRDEIR